MKIFIDVTNTFLTGLNTGIQVVTRELIRTWSTSSYDFELVIFDEERDGYVSVDVHHFFNRRLTARERWEMVDQSDLSTRVPDRLVVLELPDSADHIDFLVGLRDSGQLSTLAMYVYDLVPLTMPRTTAGVGTFAKYSQLLIRSSVLIPMSEATARSLRALCDLTGTPPARISVLPPIISSGLADKSETVTVFRSDRRRRRVSKEISILMVGSVEPRKNHLNAILAIERFWKSSYAVRLTIAGCRAWNVEPTLRLIRELQVRGRPISLKLCPSGSELADIYSEHDIVLFPSLGEGFGLPVAEAIAHGCIPVTSNVSATAEFSDSDDFKRQDGTLVDPTSIDDIEQGLQHAINCAAKRRDVSRRPAIDTVDWKMYGRQIWKLITSENAAMNVGDN